MDNKSTLKEIARRANVSIGTVHKALYNKKGVSEQKRREILEIANSNSYRKPNPLGHKVYRFAAVFPKPDDNNRFFYQQVWDGIHARARELEDFHVEVRDYMFQGDYRSQHGVLESLYQNHPEELDAVITVVWKEALTSSLIDQFAQAGVPVFTIAADAPLSKRTTTVMTNPYKIGRIAGEYMGSVIRGPGRVIIVGTKRDANNHALTVRGFFDQMLESCPDVEIIELYDSVTYPEKLYETLYELALTLDNVLGIYINNARATSAVCSIMKRKPIPHSIFVLGSELFDESEEHLLRGTLHAIIDQNPFEQGYQGIGAVFSNVVCSKPLEQKILINARLLLRNSIRQWEMD